MIQYDDSSLMKVWHVRPGQEDHPGFEWLWTCLYWRVLQRGRGDDGDGDYDNADDENDSGWWFSQLVSLLHAWGGWHDWLQGLHEACRQQNDSNRKTSPKLINYSHIETCKNQKVTNFQHRRLGGTLVIVLTLIRFLWVWGIGWKYHSHGTELRWGCQKIARLPNCIVYYQSRGWGTWLSKKSTWFCRNKQCVQKPIGGGFVGTSPSLELALYTTCLLAR